MWRPQKSGDFSSSMKNNYQDALHPQGARWSVGRTEIVTATGGYSVLLSIVTKARIPTYKE
ncbi:hypothetical protein T11_6985 [Trichinella zimbabwensis]|uniref:Uncharacterized protein n=1 Tax=Trichinella zimbabwensis TaxID=268475 RepID=A0A0V1GYS5_9BILA|nr:hypothetical protein T11_6985 [Trichinella zimbabwensis]